MFRAGGDLTVLLVIALVIVIVLIILMSTKKPGPEQAPGAHEKAEAEPEVDGPATDQGKT